MFQKFKTYHLFGDKKGTFPIWSPVKRFKLFTQQYTTFVHHLLHVVLLWSSNELNISPKFCSTRELNKDEQRDEQRTTSLNTKEMCVVEHLSAKFLWSQANFTQQETTLHNMFKQDIVKRFKLFLFKFLWSQANFTQQETTLHNMFKQDSQTIQTFSIQQMLCVVVRKSCIVWPGINTLLKARLLKTFLFGKLWSSYSPISFK